MAPSSDRKHHISSTQDHSHLYPSGSDRLRFCIKALVAIFIAEVFLMFLLPLLPPMPTIVTALLDAFLLVAIISLLFGPQLKSEITIQNARFIEAQDTLRKSEERYRALVESTEDST